MTRTSAADSVPDQGSRYIIVEAVALGVHRHYERTQPVGLEPPHGLGHTQILPFASGAAGEPLGEGYGRAAGGGEIDASTFLHGIRHIPGHPALADYGADAEPPDESRFQCVHTGGGGGSRGDDGPSVVGLPHDGSAMEYDRALQALRQIIVGGLQGAHVHLVASRDDGTIDVHGLAELQRPDGLLRQRSLQVLQNPTPWEYSTLSSVILADALRVAQHPMFTATGRLAVWQQAFLALTPRTVV